MTRRKKLKTAIVVLLVLLIVVPVAWRLIYGAMMDRRWQAKLAELRAAGEPLTLAELAPSPIPDNQNAAVVYEQAFAQFEGMSAAERRRVGRLAVKKQALSSAELDEARGLISRWASALGHLRQGASLSECRFPVDYSLPGGDIPLPHLAGMQSGADLLLLSFRVNVADGKGAHAAKDCLDALRLARGADTDPFLISALVEIAISDSVLRQLQSALDRLDMPAEVLKEVAAVIGNVEDRGRFVRIMKGERCIGLSTFDMVLGKGGGTTSFPTGQKTSNRPGAVVVLLRPVFVADASRYVDIMGRWIELAGHPSAESREKWAVVVDEIEAMHANAWRHIVSGFILPSLFRSLDAWDRGVGREGCAKLAIALRLYRMKHGQYPDDLAALVPEFLDQLPTDPFSGKGFIYRREGQGFIVYSVGVNGTDDGGVEDPKSRDPGDIVWKSSR